MQVRHRTSVRLRFLTQPELARYARTGFLTAPNKFNEKLNLKAAVNKNSSKQYQPYFVKRKHLNENPFLRIPGCNTPGLDSRRCRRP
ncbi:hypothetical protein ACO0LL_21180, partial [Undibacterium sp. TC4M20W]|uniref:hypothetical protein n=1 Tax=Undibacterium sp. TC4M20W TaxID=3413052 RepID=UPI003BF2844E